MMNDMIRMILFLSASGTLLALLLLVLKRLLQNKFSKKWHYYIWIIVILRLIVPIGLPINVFTNGIFMKADQSKIDVNESFVDTSIPRLFTDYKDFKAPHQFLQEQNIVYANKENSPDRMKPTSPTLKGDILRAFNILVQNLGLIWLIICFILLGKRVLCYRYYLENIKKTSKLLKEENILDSYFDTGKSLGIKKDIPILSNPDIVSPMQIGLLKPMIILPEKQITNVTHLRYIFMHELIHYKRRDLIYKWLVQIVLCIHWFNPIVYFISKVINKACELSCDEAVIKKLSYLEQRAYGDTLIYSLELVGASTNAPLSLTLVENVKFMKERLGAIMKFQKKSKIITCLSVFITAILCVGAMFTVAYAKTAKEEENIQYNESHNNSVNSVIDIDIKKLKANEKVILGPYYLEKNAGWSVDIESWEGKGTLFIADMKDGEAFHHGIALTKAPDGFAFIVDESKNYYITIGNESNNSLENIKGKLTLNYKGSYQSPKDTKDASSILVNIPKVQDEIFIKSYPKCSLKKNDKVHVALNWEGNGAVLALYTKEKFSSEEIKKLVRKGHLPLVLNGKASNKAEDKDTSLSADYTFEQDADDGQKGKTYLLSFNRSQNNSIDWNNKISETCDYYFYIITEGDTGIKNLNGKITFEGESKKDNAKVNLKDNLSVDLNNNPSDDLIDNAKDNSKDNTKDNSKDITKDVIIDNKKDNAMDNAKELLKSEGIDSSDINSNENEQEFSKKENVEVDSEEKDNKVLDHMKKWSGFSTEEVTDAGIKFTAEDYTGDKINYSFTPDADGSKTLDIKASLKGEFEIDFITSDRSIIKSIPSFTGSKEVTLKDLPAASIDMIIRSNQVSGSLTVTAVTTKEDLGSVVFDFVNKNSKNVIGSGSFNAEEGQTLSLKVLSDIKGGSVDLFLFDPNGKEQRFTIENSDFTKEIELTKGKWAYNCTGFFKQGNVRIKGILL